MERVGFIVAPLPLWEIFRAVSPARKAKAYGLKINYKGMIKLVNISKEEAHELNKKYGVNFGCNGISHTYTKHKRYFLCENPKNIGALKKVRDAKAKG